MTVLEVRHLHKSFGSIAAVTDVSFSIEAGEVFTIIGPNGAGKTTTLEMIEGLQTPDQGEVTINGLSWKQNGDAIKQLIGVQPQSSAMYDLLTVYENLDVFASFYHKSIPAERIMELINLTDHRNKRVKNLSGGQKQRLAIGLALVNDPEILFLDEPTTGLDPQARRNIWDIVLRLKELGKTTILTTHYMEEADILSDRVCIIDQGKVIANDTPKNLIQQLTKEREINLSFVQGASALSAMNEVSKQLPAVNRVNVEGNHLKVWSTKPEETLYHLLEAISKRGYEVDQIAIKDMSLEDVFISFTGKEWRD